MSEQATRPENERSLPDGTQEGVQQEATQILEDLEQLRTERDKFLELLQRTRADFENYQKRVQRDLEQERRYALAPLARELLPVLDNLERALAAVKEETSLSQGIAMVRSLLLGALERHGIRRIEATGQPFDPHLHQAVAQQPSTEHPPNTVLQVLEEGYLYHDRVLRPSKVIVSKEGTEQPE